MNNVGSIWRKWDLQVGTRNYTRYKGVHFGTEKLNTLCTLTGLNPEKINSNHKEMTNEEYAKLFVEHFVHYNEMDVIAFANHNCGEGIEEILAYLNKKKDENPNSKYIEKHIFLLYNDNSVVFI